jgi:hypothetical protein
MARETLARKITFNTEESDGEGRLVPGTPPRPVGKSQGGTTTTLALGPSPEQSRHIPPRPTISLFLQIISRGTCPRPRRLQPPLRLEEEGQGKRRRLQTDRYEISKAQADIDESQHGK